MFIILLTYKSSIEEIEKFMSEHINFLDEQYRLRNFQLSGRKVPRTGGVIIATVASRGELDKILAKDPFHREGLADFEIIEIVPSKSSPELAHLTGC